jgi:predicted DNA-binding WGR domain protein
MAPKKEDPNAIVVLPAYDWNAPGHKIPFRKMVLARNQVGNVEYVVISNHAQTKFWLEAERVGGSFMNRPSGGLTTTSRAKGEEWEKAVREGRVAIAGEPARKGNPHASVAPSTASIRRPENAGKDPHMAGYKGRAPRPAAVHQRRRFVFSAGRSNKFWEIAIAGPSFTTYYGRIGHAAQHTEKTWKSEDEALDQAAKLIVEKMKKGYVEVALEVGSKAARPSADLAPVKAALDAPKPKALISIADVMKTAKYLGVQFTGTPESAAAVVWALQHGRFDTAVIFDNEKCASPSLESYAKALAKTYDLPYFNGDQAAIKHWKVKQCSGIVIILPDQDGPAVEERTSPNDPCRGAVGIRPIANRKAAEGLLDAGRVRPPPSYYVPVTGATSPGGYATALAKAGRAMKAKTFEKAVAAAAASSGKFPPALVLYDTGEKREAP